MAVYEDMYIQVTADCNQGCIFCTQPKQDYYYPLDKLKKYILECKGKGFKRFVLTGGEPTLHPDIVEIIRFIYENGLVARMITNGSKLSDREFCRRVIEAGWQTRDNPLQITFSIHAHTRELFKRITKKDNLDKALAGIRNVLDLGGEATINITIIKWNYPYLEEYARFMVENFPEVSHYVLNFVEVGGRARENLEVIPKVSEIELELKKAMEFLSSKGKTMRVERVPLCYMCDFERFSSETRRMLGNQEYHSYFIEDGHIIVTGKDTVYKESYEKSKDCESCTLSGICAGLKNNYTAVYGLGELYPMFKRAKDFMEMNLSD